ERDADERRRDAGTPLLIVERSAGPAQNRSARRPSIVPDARKCYWALRMRSPGRLAPVALASMTFAADCFNPDITAEVEWQESMTDGGSTDVDSTGGTSPISTVTGDASASGSPASGASEGSSDPTADTDPTTGADAADEPPTIDLLID